jgi:methanogenic corrinoid protein MtbC1
MGRRGWSVRYLGADTPTDGLVDACQTLQPDLLVLSSMRSDLLEAVVPSLAPLAGDLRIAIGGRGSTQDIADRLGGDLLPFDLVEAADILNEAARDVDLGQ